MKLSDKLLILLVLGAFAIVGSAHLNIYSRYRNGLSFINNMQLHKTYPTPAHLSLTGFLNVTITPADSFSIEYEAPDANADGPVRRKEGMYREHTIRRAIIPWYNGDTMMMSGIDTVYPNGDKYQQEYIPTQSVHIYTPNLPSISVQGGLLNFDAGPKATHPLSGHLLLENVQLAQAHTSLEHIPELGQLSVECVNSRIEMQDNMYIRQLQLRLDSTSSAVLMSTIDSLSLQYHDASQIELKGALMRHLSKH